MDVKADMFKELTDMFMCSFCALRFIDEKDVTVYEKCITNQRTEGDEEPLKRKQVKHSPCISCLGFFRPSICEETITRVSSFILDSGHDSDTFNVSLTLPVSFLLRSYSLASFVRQRWPALCSAIEFWPPNSVKNLWKDIIAPQIASRVNRKFDLNSELDIKVKFVYADDEKECLFLCSKFSQVRKNNEISQSAVDKILRGTYRQWLFEDYFPSPPLVPNKFVEFQDVSLHHFSVYCGGRYNKWSRNLSQTPWLIKGKRKTESSVEELITDLVRKAFKATKTMFGSSGREDVDVRCLGRGRPFYIELINPQVTKLTKEQLSALQEEINTLGRELIRIHHLQLIDKSNLALIKDNEEKKKSYCAYCVVWGPMPDLKHLSSLTPFDLEQKTPLRVLHRRPLLTRLRTVYELCGIPGKETLPDGPSFFKINITTQAGTYIKEFVHSDFGRTKPSLGHFLGGIKVSILALDVIDICLDWPPTES